MITITKKQVLKALATEPLEPGSFFQDDENPAQCNVCAVGAVLRHGALRAIRKVVDGWVTYNDVAFDAVGGPAVADGTEHLNMVFNSPNISFLSKLSCEFEHVFYIESQLGFSSKESTEIARLHAINVTEAICPEVIELDI